MLYGLSQEYLQSPLIDAHSNDTLYAFVCLFHFFRYVTSCRIAVTQECMMKNAVFLTLMATVNGWGMTIYRVSTLR